MLAGVQRPDPLGLMASAIDELNEIRRLIERFSGAIFISDDPRLGVIGMITLVMTRSLSVHVDNPRRLALPLHEPVGESLRVATLLSLWVEAPYRGAGVGGALVRHAVAEARTRRAGIVMVAHDRRERRLAIFYARLGFEEWPQIACR
jgi:GNAT superfamily N-acetyltransferase